MSSELSFDYLDRNVIKYRDHSQLLHGKRGKRQHKHRIIFTVREETVYVLYVRHTARDELEP